MNGEHSLRWFECRTIHMILILHYSSENCYQIKKIHLHVLLREVLHVSETLCVVFWYNTQTCHTEDVCCFPLQTTLHFAESLHINYFFLTLFVGYMKSD